MRVVLVIGAVVLLCGCGAAEVEVVATPAPAPTYTSAEWGYAVTVPDGWYRAEESLTPNLVDPREVLSLATFPLRYVEGACAHLPTGAVEAMTDADVLLTIQERGVGSPAEAAGFPPRPAHFHFEPGQDSEAVQCVRGPVRFVDHWFTFADGGRHFHVEVAIGRSAPESRRLEAYRILDSLRIDPSVRPDWRSSG